MALAGSLDREVEARIEQEPGTESKAKKLTRLKTNITLIVNSICLGAFPSVWPTAQNQNNRRMRNQRRASVGGEGADASGIVPPSPLIR